MKKQKILLKLFKIEKDKEKNEKLYRERLYEESKKVE